MPEKNGKLVLHSYKMNSLKKLTFNKKKKSLTRAIADKLKISDKVLTNTYCPKHISKHMFSKLWK